MRYSSIVIMLVLFLTGCGSDSFEIEERTVLTDVLTLELTFGADEEKLEDEFLLASPEKTVVVNDAGDIYVLDEMDLNVKVFDKNGEPKIIFGGPGQGPGEFYGATYWQTISSTGYLLVSGQNWFVVFSPNNKFIKNIRYTNNPVLNRLLEENDWRSSSLGTTYVIDDSHFLTSVTTRDNSDESLYPEHELLVYLKEDNPVEIARYQSSRILTSMGLLPVSFRGSLLFNPIHDNSAVYSHSEFDKFEENNRSFYTLNIISFDNNIKRQITCPYKPVKIPQSQKEEAKRFIPEIPGTEKLIKEIDKAEYYPPLRKLLVDRDFIFAFTNMKNDEEYILTDVLDASVGKYLVSAYFPFIPSTIKDGYAYIIGKNDEGFDVVEKYKVSPAVYGK
ncbi:hypothetical protein AMJ80_00760 [bacterium SM23_31]|nr:MAG: hypothetical protein AMJ80_00760 [bacterium SM23_31]